MFMIKACNNFYIAILKNRINRNSSPYLLLLLLISEQGLTIYDF